MSKLTIIQRTLWELNIPPNYLGAHYLAYAELLVLENQDRLTMVTKWLYPEVAGRYQTSWKSVERNIRTAITSCWNTEQGRAGLQALAGCTLNRRPSPTGMIQLLARYFMRQPEHFWQEGAPPQNEPEPLV